jgi:hypothetical protein
MQPIVHDCTPANTEKAASTLHSVPFGHTTATLNRRVNLQEKQHVIKQQKNHFSFTLHVHTKCRAQGDQATCDDRMPHACNLDLTCPLSGTKPQEHEAVREKAAQDEESVLKCDGSSLAL